MSSIDNEKPNGRGKRIKSDKVSDSGSDSDDSKPRNESNHEDGAGDFVVQTSRTRKGKRNSDRGSKDSQDVRDNGRDTENHRVRRGRGDRENRGRDTRGDHKVDGSRPKRSRDNNRTRTRRNDDDYNRNNRSNRDRNNDRRRKAGSCGRYNKDKRSGSKSRPDADDNDHKREEPEEEYEDVGNNVAEKTDLPEYVDDFEDMGFLTEELFLGIHEYGFKRPSPIQSRTIHIINSGSDLIAQSQSGTGKTGAFTIGSLSRIDPSKCYPQVIIVANTRDLASQIAKVTESISNRMNVKVCLCVGAHKNNPYVNAQEAKNSHVLVGTPGRVGDLMHKRAFDGNKIRTLIMDESDVLLKVDFREQIIDIIKHICKNTQICIFSATFTKETLEVTENFLRNPYRVTVEKEKLSLERVKQYKISVGYDRNKLVTLKDLYGQLFIAQMIVFVGSVRSAEYLRDKLMDDKIEAGLVHGRMSSLDRENVLKEFRLANLKTLITTDVMCRGIDIDDLKMVINYDMARDAETYIHRVGRSGRYGGQGVAINFCTYDDMPMVKSLERNYNIYISDMPDPEEVNVLLIGMEPPSYKVSSAKNYAC